MKKRLFLASITTTIISILILTLIPFSLNADTSHRSYTVSYDDPLGTYNWTNPDGENINSVYMELYCHSCGHVDWSEFFTQDGYRDYIFFSGSISGIGTPDITIVANDSGENDFYTLWVTYNYDVWIRDRPMTCYRVWINEDNNFQFVFWYPYADNNWVRIYGMDGNMVYEIDMPYDNPNLIVDLPDGMYTVKTFTVGSTEPIQTFVIGK